MMLKKRKIFSFLAIAVTVFLFIAWRNLLPQKYENVILPSMKTEFNRTKDKLLYLAKDDVTMMQNAYPAVLVQATGPLRTRIRAMSDYLNKYRNLLLSRDNNFYNKTWTPIKGPLKVLDGLNLDFLKQVADSGDVIPIYVPWIVQPGGTKQRPLNSLEDNTNLLVQKYYQWTGESNLCNWINSGVTNLRYHVTHESKCVSNKSMHKKPDSLLLITLNNRPANKFLFPTYPPILYTEFPKHAMYVLIATNAVITNVGDLITYNTKFVAYTCSHDINTKYDPNFEKAALYEEVFSVSQFWGTAFFHKNIEDFPRMAPFLPWLRDKIEIKIHVQEPEGFTAKILGLLGISQNRLISGHVRAKIAYLPEPSGCGHNLVTQTQLLSAEYNDIIRNKFKQTQRNSVVLIRRSGVRRLTQHKETEAALKKAAEEHKLKFELFIDNPSPPLEEAMKMFNRAVMVVAPHGAGLSNILFSQPETFVIEAVCNRPHVNLCYQRLAYTLGFHYHAIPSKYGCEGSINIDLATMENSIKEFIPIAAKLRVD